MSPSITNTMRRFSRGSGNRNSAYSSTNPQQSNTTTTGAYTPPLQQGQQQHGGIANTGAGGVGLHDNQHNSRPVSSSSDASFEHMNRPGSQQYNQGVAPTSATTGGMSSLPPGHHATQPHSAIGGLSRTDQVVLRYFWEEKYLDNAKRDLHFLKFPFFPQYPAHTDLMPYCEIYHLVKTTPGANIISLGSANGVYIGFELAQGAQLHIDMDDEWRDISHHRVIFKPFESMLRDPTSDTTFKSWPKPLTIEFLEEQYRAWMRDLTSFCWIDEAVRDLGGEGGVMPGEHEVAPPMTGQAGMGTGHGASAGMGPSAGSGMGPSAGIGSGSAGVGTRRSGGLEGKRSREL